MIEYRGYTGVFEYDDEYESSRVMSSKRGTGSTSRVVPWPN